MPILRIGLLSLANVLVGLVVYFSTVNNSFSSNNVGDSSPVKGQLIWQQKNCISCHSIYGLGGHIGPDLTNVMRRRGSEYARYRIVNGRNKMPPQSLDANDVTDLLSYLNEIDQTGIYPPTSLNANSFGEQ